MKKRHKLSEADLVCRVSALLNNEGYRVRHEVPNMGQSADIVATRGETVLAIEAKISNWSRAVRQCKAHELVADFVCIALDRVPDSMLLMETIEEMGYGLISLSDEGDAEWVVEPSESTNVWLAQREEFLKIMEGIAYAC